MKHSQFEMQIRKDQLLQPLTEIAQQNIRGGQAGGDYDELPDEIIWDVAGGTFVTTLTNFDFVPPAD